MNDDNELTSPEEKSETTSEKTFHHPNDNCMNPWFFKDIKLCQGYVTYQKRYFSMWYQIPYIIVGLSYLHTTTVFSFGADSQAYYLFTASLILIVISSCTFFIYIWAQVALSNKWYNEENDPKGTMRARCCSMA